jgi:hypothetical protein
MTERRGEKRDRRRGRDASRLPAYFSHHKCATMWVNGILERLCRENGLRFRSFDDASQFGGDLPGHLEREPVDLLSYINARWEHVRRLDDVVGFHVVRDPRDILVSAYFSHMNSHRTEAWPELEEHRRQLRSASKRDGLFLEIEFSADVFDAIRGWDYGSEAVLELTFEEITTRPYRTFLRVFEHLGLLDDRDLGLRRQLGYVARGLWNQVIDTADAPRSLLSRNRSIPGERLLAVVYQNRFDRKAGGRSRGEEDPGSHYRKGVAGDWRNHLDDEHLDELELRFPGLMEVAAPDRAEG